MKKNRDSRMQWMERLVARTPHEKAVRRALVANANDFRIGVEFERAIEVCSQEAIQPFALLPDDYHGVLRHEGFLVPVIDLGGHEDKVGLVVITQAGEDRLGFHFHGVPEVVNLDEAKPLGANSVPCEGLTNFVFPGTQYQDEFGNPFLLVDIDALVEELLERV